MIVRVDAVRVAYNQISYPAWKHRNISRGRTPVMMKVVMAMVIVMPIVDVGSAVLVLVRIITESVNVVFGTTVAVPTEYQSLRSVGLEFVSVRVAAASYVFEMHSYIVGLTTAMMTARVLTVDQSNALHEHEQFRRIERINKLMKAICIRQRLHEWQELRIRKLLEKQRAIEDGMGRPKKENTLRNKPQHVHHRIKEQHLKHKMSGGHVAGDELF
jgi:hypothetical protein